MIVALSLLHDTWSICTNIPWDATGILKGKDMKHGSIFNMTIPRKIVVHIM